MNYFVEANIGIAFLYGVYVLILGRENDFSKQRIALLGIVVVALVFPLIEIAPAIENTALATFRLPEVQVGPATTSSNYIFIVYTTITCIVALPFLIHALRLYRIPKQGHYRGSYVIVESDKPLPSWSFFKLIYIGRANELNAESKELIIKHEMQHGRLLHSVDMLLVTVLCILCWFNPFLWLLRRTLAKVHEFQVDDIIARQNGVADYTMLLAKTALLNNGFLLTHHFNQSFILKRINMINMIKNRISNWKLAGFGVAVVLYLVTVACNDQVNEKKENSSEPLTIVDDTAMPKEGMTAFYDELGSQLQYPEQARQMGVEGKVYVEFVVGETGKLADFMVVKGIGAGCDAAALDVMKKMKDWTPGKENGKAVAQKMVLPISFKLN